jgi:hypothetical protein
MKCLYHLSQTRNRKWDTYSDFVVCAKSEQAACSMHPDKEVTQTYDEWIRHTQGDDYDWTREWVVPCHVTCMLIGTASDDLPLGVVCASYHAG